MCSHPHELVEDKTAEIPESPCKVMRPLDLWFTFPDNLSANIRLGRVDSRPENGILKRE